VDSINRIIVFLSLASLLGCSTSATNIPDDLSNLSTSPPVITEVSWSCDADLERWRLDITCDAWSNGGRLYLSNDFSYTEEHQIKSRKSAADGSWDELRLDLYVTTDWREVTGGSSTAFDCTEEPNGLFIIYDRDGKTVDCRLFGENPSGWRDVQGAPECDIPWADTGFND
jgi:hypothetical protein